MDLDEDALKIKEELDKYLSENDKIKYNTDEKTVNAVINGLAKRQNKYGEAYCPCRLMTGDKNKDKDIICPCKFHMQEVTDQEMCHCKLFMRKE
ncbi:MAG: ferredoxin-thioredoxin reductase catalytic domain-containing protein [Planctomycetota bacterium]